MKIGDKFRDRIHDSIRVHEKLLLLLSEQSIASIWVEREVLAALELEEKQNRIILVPIRLDDSILSSEKGWAAEIRHSRQIGDFTGWKDHDLYQKAFDRLLRDLQSKEAREGKG